MTRAELHTLFEAVVCRHLHEDAWRLLAAQPLASLPPPLQADLRRTFGIEGPAIMLLFEPEEKAAP